MTWTKLQKLQDYLLVDYLSMIIIDDTQFFEFKKTHTAIFDGVPVKFVVIETHEKCVRPIMFADILCPTIRNDFYSILKLGQLSDCQTLRVTDVGTPERIIEISSLVELKSKLKRFYRYYDKSSYTTKDLTTSTITESWETIRNIFIVNGLKLAKKYNTNWSDSYATNQIMKLIAAIEIANQRAIGYYDTNGVMFAIAVVDYDKSNDMLHWVNTYRDESVSRSGNTVILDLIDYCINSKISKLNLGLDFFEYKKSWSEVSTCTLGFEFVEPQALSIPSTPRAKLETETIFNATSTPTLVLN